MKNRQKRRGRGTSGLRGGLIALGVAGSALAVATGVHATRQWTDRAGAAVIGVASTPIPGVPIAVVPETPAYSFATETGTPFATVIAGLANDLPTPPPESPVATPIVPSQEMLDLQAVLQQMTDDYWDAGSYAIAVTDLQTGETISVNGDRPQLSGCVMNYFVLLRTVLDLQEGDADFDDGVDYLVRETIAHSDASTAQELYERAGDGDVLDGVQRVSDLIHGQLGLGSVVLDHPPAFGDDTIGVDNDNWVTANDMNRAMAQLYHGESLDPTWTAYLLDAMTGVYDGLNYMVAYGNGGVTSHKNGFFPYEDGYVDNDTGIVRFERNGQEYAYAVTFLSEGVQELYADLWLGRPMMEQIWAYFDAKYPDLTPGADALTPNPSYALPGNADPAGEGSTDARSAPDEDALPAPTGESSDREDGSTPGAEETPVPTDDGGHEVATPVATPGSPGDNGGDE